MALLYFFICLLDLMCSGFYPIGGRDAEEVLWDKLLDNHIGGLLFLILARAGAVPHAGLLLIEQAVLLGASIRASVTTAVVLLVQVCAIPLSFFMRQGRKYQKGGLFQMCVFVLQFCLSDCQGLVVLAGSRAEFICMVENLQTSLWQVKRPDGTFQPFAHAGVVYTGSQEKFRLDHHRELSGNKTIYFQTLILIEATVDDDGQYICEGEGYPINTTDLTVEIPPHLYLKVDGVPVNSTVDVVVNKEVTIECIAKGGKPEVELSYSVNGEVKKGFSDPKASSKGRINSTLKYRPAIADANVTCIASGQEVLPKQEVSVAVNVQYLNCSHGVANTRSEYVLNCFCDANPDVETYKFFVNDSSYSQKILELPCDKPADVFCEASNAAVTLRTKKEFLRPFCFESVKEKGAQVDKIIWIVIAVILAMIVAAISIWAVHRYCKKRARNRKEEEDLQLRLQWLNKSGEERSQDNGPDYTRETENGTTKDGSQGNGPDHTRETENGTTKDGETQKTKVTVHISAV